MSSSSTTATPARNTPASPSSRNSTTTAVLASIGSVGDAYDNALAESFVDTFKTELIADRVWRTRAQLELAIVEWVAWFNTTRLHQSLGDIPPAELEALYARQNDPSLSLNEKREPPNPVSAKPSPPQTDQQLPRRSFMPRVALAPAVLSGLSDVPRCSSE